MSTINPLVKWSKRSHTDRLVVLRPSTFFGVLEEGQEIFVV